MENIENTVTDGNITTPETEVKTFTQDEVNRIVQERLAKERSKQTPPPLSEKELELAEREKALIRKEYEQGAREILKGHELSDKLLTVLNVSDLDGLNAALDILNEEFDFKDGKPRMYTRNPDGTWTRHDKRNPPADGVSMNLGNQGFFKNTMSDPIRRVMKLARKE